MMGTLQSTHKLSDSPGLMYLCKTFQERQLNLQNRRIAQYLIIVASLLLRQGWESPTFTTERAKLHPCPQPSRPANPPRRCSPKLRPNPTRAAATSPPNASPPS